MKFSPLLFALSASSLIQGAAAEPLSCASVAPAAAPCQPIQKLLGACARVRVDEVVCRTESKSLISPAHASKTSFGYYSAPAGYAFEPETTRAVFDGHGTHGVDASISKDQQLYCLWGTAGGGDAAGYCEVHARLLKSR